MKTLYILRHAKAVDQSAGITDFERYLTPKGEEDSKLIGKRLKELHVNPDAIVTSPAKRAYHTALLVAAEIDFPQQKMILDKSVFNADPETILDIIRSFDDEHDKVMLCGHNPTLSEIVSMLSGKNIELDKGAVTGITFDVNTWSEIHQKSGNLIINETPKLIQR